MKALYRIDQTATLRTSHTNPAVQRLYDEFLGEPGSRISHDLLHTAYHRRNVMV